MADDTVWVCAGCDRVLGNEESEQVVKDLRARVRQLEIACARANDEVCQALGQALGYPWYKDDQKNFPNATEVDGVCVGEHVAESLADEAANEIRRLKRIVHVYDSTQ